MRIERKISDGLHSVIPGPKKAASEIETRKGGKGEGFGGLRSKIIGKEGKREEI